MEREKGKASNVEVSFSALRKDVANVLDFMERLKNEEDQKAVDVDLIEKLKYKLTFICTYVQLSYSDLEQFEDVMTGKRQEVENLLRTILDGVDNDIRCKCNTHHVLPSLVDNMNECISSHHHSKSDATMMDEDQLDFLLLNLHHLSKYRAEKMTFPLVTQYEILRNVCGNVKDFHGLIVNGYIKHEMVENVLPQFQLMAERVGHFHCSFFDLDAGESILIAEDTKLEKLRILYRIVLSYWKDTEDIFKRFPNLQDLGFVLKESSDYSKEQRWFPKLDFLTELERLTVEFESSNRNDSGSSGATNWSWNFHFPLNLKILRLVDFALTSDALSTIARLPNLEGLFLYREIIEGGEWNMKEEDTFENLKYLNLSEVTLAKWEVGEESFPVLEKLKLKGCLKLEEIPPCFGDINSLKVIKLVESPHLEDSAKNIKEYAEDMRAEVVGRKNIPLFNKKEET